MHSKTKPVLLIAIAALLAGLLLWLASGPEGAVRTEDGVQTKKRQRTDDAGEVGSQSHRQPPAEGNPSRAAGPEDPQASPTEAPLAADPPKSSESGDRATGILELELVHYFGAPCTDGFLQWSLKCACGKKGTACSCPSGKTHLRAARTRLELPVGTVRLTAYGPVEDQVGYAEVEVEADVPCFERIELPAEAALARVEVFTQDGPVAGAVLEVDGRCAWYYPGYERLTTDGEGRADLWLGYCGAGEGVDELEVPLLIRSVRTLPARYTLRLADDWEDRPAAEHRILVEPAPLGVLEGGLGPATGARYSQLGAEEPPRLTLRIDGEAVGRRQVPLGSDGRFRVTLPAGTYRVSLWTEGEWLIPVVQRIAVTASATSRIQLKALLPAAVSGRVICRMWPEIVLRRLEGPEVPGGLETRILQPKSAARDFETRLAPGTWRPHLTWDADGDGQAEYLPLTGQDLTVAEGEVLTGLEIVISDAILDRLR